MIQRLATPLFVKIAAGLQVITLGAAVVLLVMLLGEQKHSLKLQDRLNQEVAAHEQTKTNYRAAAEEARAKDAQNALRVERAQSQATEEVSREYQQKLADLRRRYDALRVRGDGAPGADQGGSRGEAMPSVPGAPGGLDDATEDYRFRCEADALQLEALQSWVRRQIEANRDR